MRIIYASDTAAKACEYASPIQTVKYVTVFELRNEALQSVTDTTFYLCSVCVCLFHTICSARSIQWDLAKSQNVVMANTRI